MIFRLKKKYGFERIVIGFIFFFFADLLSIQLLIGSIKLFGLILIIGGYIKVYSWKSWKHLNYYRYIVSVYVLLCVIMIIRGYLIDYPFQWVSFRGCINYHFFDKYYVLPYFMPLVLLIDWHKINIRIFCNSSLVVAMFSIFIFIINIISISNFTQNATLIDSEETFAIASLAIFESFSFAALLTVYMSRNNALIVLFALLCNLVIFLISARRGAVLINSITLVASIFFLLQKVNRNTKYIFILIVIVVSISLIKTLISADFLGLILEKGLQDSRIDVDLALLDQTNPLEFIFGKGLNGRYYYPLQNDDLHDGWRYGTETGFLNLLLKGGILLSLTYVTMLGIPAIKGIFNSNNILCKIGGFYILLSLIELYPFGWLEFSIKFFFIWVMISICMNSTIRNMNDSQIRSYYLIGIR